MTSVDPAMLFARIRLRAPSLRSILVAGPHADESAPALARALASAIAASSLKVRWLDAVNRSAPEGDVLSLDVLESELHDPARARVVLSAENTHTVMYAGGVLDSPLALLLSAAADGVLVVARIGKTTRAELESVRAEIAGAGGHIIGAVLI